MSLKKRCWMTNTLGKLSDHIFNIRKVCNFITLVVILFSEGEADVTKVMDSNHL